MSGTRRTETAGSFGSLRDIVEVLRWGFAVTELLGLVGSGFRAVVGCWVVSLVEVLVVGRVSCLCRSKRPAAVRLHQLRWWKIRLQ